MREIVQDCRNIWGQLGLVQNQYLVGNCQIENWFLNIFVNTKIRMVINSFSIH